MSMYTFSDQGTYWCQSFDEVQVYTCQTFTEIFKGFLIFILFRYILFCCGRFDFFCVHAWELKVKKNVWKK